MKIASHCFKCILSINKLCSAFFFFAWFLLKHYWGLLGLFFSTVEMGKKLLTYTKREKNSITNSHGLIIIRNRGQQLFLKRASRLWGQYLVSVDYFSLFLQSFKHVKAILSLGHIKTVWATVC